ncbi:uncharacterized protein [Triticum aestivum]|uniref:uncharacterized protein isoform X2 n=1 Tax=Triticum aestivum TaxID=4565 RepID=UPI001D006A33|nr:uncharacterized protein LOC123125899 isoform X2 [Triticum aestivum]
MADKGKGKADARYEPWQRRRQGAAGTETEAVDDTAGTSFLAAPGGGGGSGPSQSQWRLPTPVGNLALGRGGGSVHAGFSQFPPTRQPVGNLDNGPPQHAQIGNAGAPQGHGSTVIDQQRLRGQPSSSRARAPGCSCCGGAPATRIVLKIPMCEACYRDAFMGNAPQQHAQIGYAGAPRGAVRNPAHNGPPQHAQMGPPSLHTLAPPPERQSSSRAREQQLQVQAELQALDAMRLQVANILNNPFSLVGSGPANPAPQWQSSSPGPGCYSNIFTGNQGHGSAAIDQQRQLDLLLSTRGSPPSFRVQSPLPATCWPAMRL